jgi:hypothetical protein
MGKIDNVLISLEDYTLNANQVKDVVLERLVADGLITKHYSRIYEENWQIIIIKTNWFDKWRNKFGIKEGNYRFKFVNFEP